MNKITLIVDSIADDLYNNPGDYLRQALESSPYYQHKHWGWGSSNMGLVKNQLITSEHFEIIALSEYDSTIHLNPFYFINYHWATEIFNPLLLGMMLPEAKTFLIANRIPILMFYPHEVCGSPLIEMVNFTRSAKREGLFNEIVLLSLTSFWRPDQGLLRFHEVPDVSAHHSDARLSWSFSAAFLLIWTESYHRFDYKINDLSEHQPANKKKLFLCLNHSMRDSRLLLLHAMSNANLIDDNIVSIRNPRCLDSPSVLHRLKVDKNINADADLGRMLSSIDTDILKMEASPDQSPMSNFLIELLQRAKDAVNLPLLAPDSNIDANFNINWNKEWYLDTWCSVITETFLVRDDTVISESPMFTEKSVKPILNLHPFVVFGHGHSHTFLQRLGFRTFEQSWFGLPADGAQGNRTLFERTFNLIESLKRLSALSNDELHAKWKTIEDDLLFNRDHLLNTDWCEVQKNMLLQRKS